MTSIQPTHAPPAPPAQRNDLAAALDQKREAAKAEARREDQAEETAKADAVKVETAEAEAEAPPPPPPPPEEPPPPPIPEVKAYQDAQARVDRATPKAA